MGSRLIPALLIGLLLVLHAQLWFGRGSVPQVASMKQQLAARNIINREALQRNNSLAAEVRDLQEVGMVKPNEIFVQIAQGKP